MNTFINIKKEFTPDQNWWELNPHMTHVKPFSVLYAEDSSKNKKQSSNDMWCIFYMSEPDEDLNLYYRLPEEDRLETCNNFNPVFDMNNEIIKECLKMYPEVCLTVMGRTLKITKDLFHRRNQFLKEAPYNFETMAAIDRAIAATPKMEEDFDRVYQKYLADKNKTVQLHGGRKQTARERKQIRPELA